MAGAAVPVGVHNQPPSEPSSSSQKNVCVGQAFLTSPSGTLHLMTASLLCITQRLREQGTGAGLLADGGGQPNEHGITTTSLISGA